MIGNSEGTLKNVAKSERYLKNASFTRETWFLLPHIPELSVLDRYEFRRDLPDIKMCNNGVIYKMVPYDVLDVTIGTHTQSGESLGGGDRSGTWRHK